MYALRQPPQDPLDARWHARLKSLMAEIGETFEALMPSIEHVEQHYRRFVESGYTHIPSLYPEASHGSPLLRARGELEELKRDVVAQEEIPIVLKAYSERIDELTANINMILAARHKDDAGFQKANRFIYAGPDKDIFAASCAWVKGEVLKTRAEQPKLTEICDDVLSLLPDCEGDASLLLPDHETFNVVRELHFRNKGYYAQLFGSLSHSNDTVFTPVSGDPVTAQAIKNVGSDFAITASTNDLWAVLQSQRQVIRPVDYALSSQAFYGIVAHEVGSHLLESTNGSHAKLRLLELGLERYELGNEGRAFLREQIMYEDFDDYIHQPTWYPTKASWEYRVAIHIVISLALGLHQKPHSFTELYALLVRLFRFWTAKRGLPVDEDVIGRGAWNMLVRVYKGTGGRDGVYYKDIVYLEGNIHCWNAAATRPELILYGDLGKFDVANKSHVMMLEAIGILPKN